jgi:hypothetical protein
MVKNWMEMALCRRVGAYAPVPANFTAPAIKALSDGHYFHVITYGIRSMGSYASQLTPEQRWWVIKYLRSKQGAALVVVLLLIQRRLKQLLQILRQKNNCD